MANTRRPSFAAVTRLRPASFTGSISGTHASVFAPKQSRAIASCVHRRLTPRCPAQTSGSRVNARARSTWGKGGHPLFSFRLASSFHSPTCKWVRSKEDPRRTPRDRDCPACQEEEKRPEQLTDRELAWQRQFQFWKEFLDKDPYDALFGRSNDMLKGRPWTPRFMWDQRVEPWKLRGWTVQEISNTTTKADISKSAVEDLKQKSKQDATLKSTAPFDTTTTQKPPNHTKSIIEIPAKKAPLDSPFPQPYIQAHGSWTYSSTDSSGTLTQESGDLIYDAISGRMVPVEMPTSSPQPVESKPPPLPSRPIVISPSTTLSTQDLVPDIIAVLPSSPSDHRGIAPKGPTMEAPPSLAIGKTSHSRSVSIERKLAMADRPEEDLSIPRTRSTPPPSISGTISLPFDRPNHRHTHGNLLKAQRGTENLPIIGGQHQTGRNTDVDRLKSDNKPSPIKHTLEQSWLRETRGYPKAEVQIMQDPHYRQAPAGKDPAPRNMYRYLARRERAFTHMTAYELGMHRSALLASWARKRPAPRVESAADRILKNEIAAQKLAMAAFEGKGERGRTSDAPGSSVPAPPIALRSSFSVSNEHNTIVVSGEGDMCPNVTKYCNSERIYKKKALHATMKEEQQDADPGMAKVLQKNPKALHGQNDSTSTREEQDKQNLEVYEKKLVFPPYSNGMPTAVSEDAGSHDTTSTKGICTRENLATYEEGLDHAPYANGISFAPSAKTEPLVPALDRYATKSQASQPAKSTGSLLYHILTYDAAADSFKEARSSSSPVPLTKEERLPFLNALTKLKNPHRFVSHVRTQQKQGFEIVAAHNDTLVFRRIPDVPAAAAVAGPIVEAKEPQSAATEESLKTLTPEQLVRSTFQSPVPVINPVDPSLSEPPQTQTGNFASPTGFVNHDIFEPSSSEKPRDDSLSSRGNQKIRKEEAVFSGSRAKSGTEWVATAAEEAFGCYPSSGMNSRERRRRRRGQHGRTREIGKNHGRFFRVALALSSAGVAILLFSVVKPSAATQKEAEKRETEREKQLKGLEGREHATDMFATDILVLANSWAATVRRLWATSTDEAPIKTIPTNGEHQAASKAKINLEETLSNASDAQSSHETSHCSQEDRTRWEQITAMGGQTAEAPQSGSSYTVAWGPYAAYPPKGALTEVDDVAGTSQGRAQSVAIERLRKDQSANDEKTEPTAGLESRPVEHTHPAGAKGAAIISPLSSPVSSESDRHETIKARSANDELSTSRSTTSNSEESLTAEEKAARAEAERLRQRKERLDAATDVLFDASLLSLTLGGLAWVYLRMLELD